MAKYHKLSEPVPLEDLIPGIAPKNHIIILSGDAYVGKTRLAFAMADALSSGKGYFWDPVPKLNIGYFSERSAASVQRQLNDQHLDMSDVTFITLLDMTKDEEARYGSNCIKWLEEIVAYHKFDVIFLDTFAHYLPSYAKFAGAMNDYSTMARATVDIQRLALKYDFTPFCNAHNAKEKVGSEYKSHKTKLSGSAAIAANTLALWSLSEYDGPLSNDDDPKYRKLEIAYHHGPDKVVYFKTLPNGLLQPIPKAQIDTPYEKRTKPEEALALLPTEGMPRSDYLTALQTHLDVGRTRAHNIIKTLTDTKRVIITGTELNQHVRPRVIENVKMVKNG